MRIQIVVAGYERSSRRFLIHMVVQIGYFPAFWKIEVKIYWFHRCEFRLLQLDMRGIPVDLIPMVVKDDLKCIIQRTWQNREHSEHDYYSLKFVALIIITQGDDCVQTTCCEEQIKTLFFLSRQYTLQTWITLVFLFPCTCNLIWFQAESLPY